LDIDNRNRKEDRCLLIVLPTEKLEKEQRLDELTGHILRMSDNKTVKQVFSWEPMSRQSLGRPKKCWMDCVEEDLHTAGISRYDIGRQRVSLQEIAGDRSQWRELVAASTILTAIFPGVPGLASTRMSLFWIISELMVMEMQWEL